MTAALLASPVTRAVDSLEMRWIIAGRLPEAVSAWFTRFPTGTEAREDIYLVQPRLRGLSVKLRSGGVMDVKSYLGSPGTLDLPCPGYLESWRKWSFPFGPPGLAGVAQPGWVAVRKTRLTSWFPLRGGQGFEPAGRPAEETGCVVELTEVQVRGEPWWTVGLEATGSAALLGSALQRAAGLVFARALPAAVEFGLGNSRSYVQWLWQLTEPVMLGARADEFSWPGGS
jgi:hypothetical protein